MSRTDVTQKIQIKHVSDYRKIDRLSYSALKVYNDDRKRFYRKYIIGTELDGRSDASDIGNIVDVLLTDRDNFDDYFVIASADKPSGQLLAFTDELFKITLKDTFDGEVQTTMEDRMEKAYEWLKADNGGHLRSSFTNFVKLFVNGGVDYFDELIACIGKSLITVKQFEISNRIIEKIKKCDAFNAHIGCKVLHKHTIMFECYGEPMKAEIDEIIIDEKNKVIYPFDYKVTAFVEDFPYSAFLKNGYYIQSSLYKFAIEQWRKDTEYADYRVENLAFKVACSSNYYDPLLYQTSDSHYIKGFKGFNVGKNFYKGINQLISEINFSRENDIWTVSYDNYKNGGIVNIPEFE